MAVELGQVVSRAFQTSCRVVLVVIEEGSPARGSSPFFFLFFAFFFLCFLLFMLLSLFSSVHVPPATSPTSSSFLFTTHEPPLFYPHGVEIFIKDNHPQHPLFGSTIAAPKSKILNHHSSSLFFSVIFLP